MSVESFNAYVCGIHEGKVGGCRAGCSAFIVKADDVLFASKNCELIIVYIIVKGFK